MMRGDLMTAQRAKCDLCSVYVSLDPPGLPTCTAADHPQRMPELLLSALSISFSQEGASPHSVSFSRQVAYLAGAEVTDADAEHTSSMSASFQPPGPAKRARPAVSSRCSTTSAHVASISMLMSFVVRHMCPTCKTGNQSQQGRRDILPHTLFALSTLNNLDFKTATAFSSLSTSQHGNIYASCCGVASPETV